MIDQITELLGHICAGKNKEEKRQFLLSFGFISWQQIVNSDDKTKLWLIEKLRLLHNENPVTFEIFEYLTITRPAKPKNIGEIFFSIKGYKPY